MKCCYIYTSRINNAAMECKFLWGLELFTEWVIELIPYIDFQFTIIMRLIIMVIWDHEEFTNRALWKWNKCEGWHNTARKGLWSNKSWIKYLLIDGKRFALSPTLGLYGRRQSNGKQNREDINYFLYALEFLLKAI